ncbi:hypothetical protein ACH95_08675 [Bacillus glycinifermentans]|uniref:Ribosome-dependent mRNA decay endonuclease Rae1/YacP n=1 Tax=Bacillus glycinifermentans TaxID=1664069 RepID=A0A0J6DY84_9BACI|nr:ribosome-dependent mRNA decay endonuclease Rae1/YacP [Bacillus glycinifermentans]ATH94029.1 hypothetical protein COP00_16590 [Bacillus glycinifermentans]KMM60665.1 hypothetical protein ACH95_08675 [Bacillus glycinifermentans]KRT92757.1 hypothetical protein AB447_221865 [Bacillus glycinifermentans]MEC0487265.1 ribosome-dependent mRNA decay endonuclease Rae1/YacP [Bacillus glycinifermentans]MEC0497036.1 ribosome-dependent mRNA decay endonuclease Rae1/YacP [Bacillus glycinifermentans]
MDILLVDGYNMIGAWPQLKDLKANSFEEARDLLIQKMAEYQAYTGFRVIVVFDAHLVKGIEKKKINHRVEVIFTRENETADERIEKLASDLNNIQTQIHVATSDYTEQWAIFGQGALRKSARELLREVEAIERKIEKSVKKITMERPVGKIPLSEDVLKIFEKWRRGDLE